jgi:hypothetical protein
VALIDFVVFWIEEDVLPANLVDLLPRPTKEMQMHFRATRRVATPISEVFIIHPLYTQHIIHGATDDHGNSHEIYCFLMD